MAAICICRQISANESTSYQFRFPPNIQHLQASEAVSKGWSRTIESKNLFSACPRARTLLRPQHPSLRIRASPPRGTATSLCLPGTLTPTPFPVILYIHVRMSAFMRAVGARAPAKLLEVLGKRWAGTGARGGTEQIASDGSVESLKRDKN